MKAKEGKLKRAVMLLAGLLAFGLIVPSGPAYAVSFDLTNWNETNLDATTDKVTVDATTTLGITTLVFTWVSGDSGLTAEGIDKIGYDSTVGCCAAGSTSGWGPFDSDGIPPSHNMDGFGSFLSVGAVPAAGDLVVTLVLLGDASAALNGPEDFAAHVRYGNDCSGFVSGRTVGEPESSPGCAVVPEPSSLALLGVGLIGVAIGGRRWMTKKA